MPYVTTDRTSVRGLPLLMHRLLLSSTFHIHSRMEANTSILHVPTKPRDHKPGMGVLSSRKLYTSRLHHQSTELQPLSSKFRVVILCLTDILLSIKFLLPLRISHLLGAKLHSRPTTILDDSAAQLELLLNGISSEHISLKLSNVMHVGKCAVHDHSTQSKSRVDRR